VFVDGEVDEGWDGREEPAPYVERLAGEKLDAARPEAAAHRAYACVAADTVVVIDDVILEKPEDREHADLLLQKISGRWHEVYTGLAVERIADGRRRLGHERTRVRLDLENEELRRLYLATGEPLDKAGAYGIQGWGGIFVPEIQGDFFNVMGLPLPYLRRLCVALEQEE
jgi:septum formation protein